MMTTENLKPIDLIRKNKASFFFVLLNLLSGLMLALQVAAAFEVISKHIPLYLQIFPEVYITILALLSTVWTVESTLPQRIRDEDQTGFPWENKIYGRITPLIIPLESILVVISLKILSLPLIVSLSILSLSFLNEFLWSIVISLRQRGIARGAILDMLVFSCIIFYAGIVVVCT